MNFLQKLINAVNVNFKLKLSQCHVKQGKVLQLFFSLFSLNHIQSAIIYNTYIVFLSILKIFPVLLRKKKKRIFKFRRKEMVKNVTIYSIYVVTIKYHNLTYLNIMLKHHIKYFLYYYNFQKPRIFIPVLFHKDICNHNICATMQ